VRFIFPISSFDWLWKKIQSAKQSAAQVMVRYAANAKAIHLTTKGSAFKQAKTQA
jgi:hypothetical protein